MATESGPVESRTGAHPLVIVSATVAEPDQPVVSLPLTLQVAQVEGG